jgi:hypothetical protein
MTVTTVDVAEALALAWRAFRQAASDDAGGWDTTEASAEVRPVLRFSRRRARVPALVSSGPYHQGERVELDAG